MSDKKFLLRGHNHLFSIFDRDKGIALLKSAKTTPPKNDHVIVNYSDEGMAIFAVLVDTPDLLHLEFISTAC